MTPESDRRSSAFVAASVPENYERRLAPVIFESWAKIMVDAVGVWPGASVLDVASGTGVVARLAARQSGPDGRVVATDVSGSMLAHAATLPAPPGAARIEYVEASATDLQIPAGTFDVVFCHQGLPFLHQPPRGGGRDATRARPGGVAGVAVWAAGHRLEPFDDYAEALAAAGIEPPYPPSQRDG